MRNWQVRGGHVVFVCLQVRTADNVPPITFPQDASKLTLARIGRTGWLERRETIAGLDFQVFTYRSRTLVRVAATGTYDSLSEFIEDEFLDLRHIFENEVLPQLPLSTGSSGIVWYPVIEIPRHYPAVLARPHDPSWLGDGVTSYRYRVFDSQAGKVGYVRVSRFGTACIGLGYPIVQDVINLVYERVLYPARTGSSPIHGSAEKAIAEGLSTFTAPTELNIYMQRLTLNLAVYALMFAIFFGMAQILTPDGSAAVLRAIILATSLLLTYVFGSSLNKLRLRSWW